VASGASSTNLASLTPSRCARRDEPLSHEGRGAQRLSPPLPSWERGLKRRGSSGGVRDAQNEVVRGAGRNWVCSAFVLVLLVLPSVAHAQVHWDVGAQAGAMKRFTTGGDSGAPSPGFGPTFGLQGHVALVPLVRAGLYAEQDVSPVSAEGPRTFWAGGLHFRVTPPLLSSPWRTWLFVGAGYAYAYSRGVHADGGFLEVPVGLGLGRKLGAHGLLFTELGARFGVISSGRMYDRSTAGLEGVPFLGQDSFALGLTLGLSLER
jgi:hypothetical protein